MKFQYLILLIFLFSPSLIAEVRKVDLGGGLILVLDERDFLQNENEVLVDTGLGRYRVNGRFPFGTDSGNPSSYLKSATLSYRGKVYNLDVSNMYNTRGSTWIAGECATVDWCTVRATFSIGGGFFGVEWSVRNGDAVRTMISDSSDIIKLLSDYVAHRKKLVKKVAN